MRYLATTITLCLSVAAFSGCGDIGTAPESNAQASSETEQHDHDHDHDHAEEPANFDEAVQSVESMKTTICKAFSDGTPEDAHGLLHDVGHSLEKIPDLAAKAGELTPEQLDKVNAAVEALFDGFGKLDDTMHGGDEVDVDELETKLTKAVTDLREAVK